MKDEWLANLTVGDEVVVSTRAKYSLRKIDRTTATLLIVGRSRFMRKDGVSYGDLWTNSRILEPTPIRREDVQRESLRCKLGNYEWKNLPLATLTKVNQVLIEAEAGE